MLKGTRNDICNTFKGPLSDDIFQSEVKFLAGNNWFYPLWFDCIVKSWSLILLVNIVIPTPVALITSAEKSF